MSKETKTYETSNKYTSLLVDTYPECICSKCQCGKRRCFICGSGSLPLDFELCKIHDFCSAGLKGCLETSVYIVNGKKHYLGPLDNYERTVFIGQLAKCIKCRSHKLF
tara:strand:+ start:119 stop:442 length:324 start_codon:yes stop_codon:yes gene_type:complete